MDRVGLAGASVAAVGVVAYFAIALALDVPTSWLQSLAFACIAPSLWVLVLGNYLRLRRMRRR